MDFEDFFSGNNNQYSQNQGCEPFNDLLSLQSPISMPSADPSNIDMPTSYIGTTDYLSNSSISSKAYDTPSYSSKNRISDFTDDNYDLAYNFMTPPISQTPQKSNFQAQKSLKCEIPIPQVALSSIQQPSNNANTTQEPQLNLTLTDILNNFTLIKQQQQQQQQQKALSVQQKALSVQQKQTIPYKKKIQPSAKKKSFQPFVSIESCEFTVDRLRSFIETHKRRSMNHF